jgi:predicted dienelactone hydrolase
VPSCECSEPGIRVLHDASRRDYREPSRPRPVRVYEWEPPSPAGTPVPLVVVSHGTGGSGGDMPWLVEPLIAAGLRVIAVDHHGNNYVDGYEPEGLLFVWERPRDITFVLDVLADEKPHGPVGAAGFSVGGYTVAALAGAQLDPQAVAAVLTGRAPLPPIPEFPAVLAALRQKVAEEVVLAAVSAAGADVSDPRVRAVFQVAPGIGSLVTPESLRAVPIPVEVRWGGSDTIMTFEENIKPYVAHISGSSGHSAGPKVRHEDFFEPEPADPAMRSRVGADAAGFFRKHLT